MNFLHSFAYGDFDTIDNTGKGESLQIGHHRIWQQGFWVDVITSGG